MIAAFALAGLASYAVIANLVPLLSQGGISTGAAAVALGLGGAGQVLGRLGYERLVRRAGVVPRTVLIMAGVAATTALLGVFTAYAALVAVAIGAGVMRGIMTLLQATAAAGSTFTGIGSSNCSHSPCFSRSLLSLALRPLVSSSDQVMWKIEPPAGPRRTSRSSAVSSL